MTSEKGRPPRAEDDLLDWFTVSYRSMAVAIVLALAVGGGLFWYWHHAPPQPSPPPPTRREASSARFVSIEGSVKVKSVGNIEWVTADKSMVLNRSDLVRTSPGATAEIEFFNGTVVHIRPDSLITIEETSEDPRTREQKVVWRISSGEVNFQTARKNVPGSSTEVSTPTITATAGELTTGGVKVADAGDTEVKLFKGSGQVETKNGQKVTLNTNEGLKVDANGKAGAKAALPDVPVLQAPPHQAEISYPDPSRATTLLAWNAVAAAASYHFQIDYSAYFNRPIYDRRGWKGTSIELRGLDVGKYYWRVAAIDKDDNEGSFSDFARFTVTRPTPGQGDGPPPPLVIESLDLRTNILQIKGRTEPGATVSVNGQRVDVGTDGAFTEFITLEKPGKQTVLIRATGLNGGVTEQRRPVVVAAF